jgi:hypothetical protein
VATLKAIHRRLNGAEKRLLLQAISHRRRRQSKALRRIFCWAAIVFGALWAFSIFATIADKRGPSWYVSGLIWLGVGLPMTLWAYVGVRSDLAKAISRFESALKRNMVSNIAIQSEQFVEFEEEEDEGACYAFQLTGHRIVFVSGQEFYSSSRFPNSDFSLVDICSEDGTSLLGHIENRGHKVEPLRTIPSEKKSELKIPDHLQVIDGDVEDIEQLLS